MRDVSPGAHGGPFMLSQILNIVLDFQWIFSDFHLQRKNLALTKYKLEYGKHLTPVTMKVA